MYSENDFRYYKNGSYLAHFGVKGMKWGKKKKKSGEPLIFDETTTVKDTFTGKTLATTTRKSKLTKTVEKGKSAIKRLLSKLVTTHETFTVGDKKIHATNGKYTHTEVTPKKVKTKNGVRTIPGRTYR